MINYRPFIVMMLLLKFTFSNAQPVIQIERILADQRILMPESFVRIEYKNGRWIAMQENRAFSEAYLSCFVFSTDHSKQYMLLMDWGPTNQLHSIWLSASFYELLFKKEKPIFVFEQCSLNALKEFTALRQEESLLQCIRHRLEYCID